MVTPENIRARNRALKDIAPILGIKPRYMMLSGAAVQDLGGFRYWVNCGVSV